MNKTKLELINLKSDLSSMRWVLITCVQYSIALAVLAIVGYLVLRAMGKNIDASFLNGVAVLITAIVGIPTFGKATQSFAEEHSTLHPDKDKDTDKNRKKEEKEE